MKRLLFTTLFICSALSLFAQNNTEDSLAVRSVVQRYEDAWNKNDMVTVCNLFTEDGSWINIGGLYWKNKVEITKAHVAFAPYLKYMVPSNMNIQNIQFIAPGVSLVFIHEALHMNHDLTFPDGRKAAQGQVIYDEISLVLVKNLGQWQIKTGHNTAVDPQSEAMNPVKENK